LSRRNTALRSSDLFAKVDEVVDDIRSAQGEEVDEPGGLSRTLHRGQFCRGGPVTILAGIGHIAIAGRREGAGRQGVQLVADVPD
jgi:hypothetical protein